VREVLWLNPSRKNLDLQGVRQALRFENQVKFRVGGTTVGLHAGDCVFVLPNEERQFSGTAGGNALLYLVMLENYQKQVQSQFFN
jgi:hypothetical protein